MKDSLFELLLNLFEKTIAQLKKQHDPEKVVAETEIDVPSVDGSVDAPAGSRVVVSVQVEQVKSAEANSIRVFTQHERIKLTKASQQCLARMVSWGVITPDMLELIINRLVFSESRFVSLEETKWAIRNTLSSGLNPDQLSFLELVLYQKEDQLAVH